MNDTNKAEEAFNVDDLKKFLKGKEHFEIFKFPGSDNELAIRILTQNELDDIEDVASINLRKRYAIKDAKENPTDKIYPFDERIRLNEINRQSVYKAVIKVPTIKERETGMYTKFFESPEQIGDLLQIDQIELLSQYYNDFQEKYSPIRNLREYSDFDKLIADVKKNSILLQSLSTFELIGLVDFMVKNPEILQKDNGMSPSPSNKSKPMPNEKKLNDLPKGKKEEKAL